METGDWGLPGGHLEFGESAISGAKRELFEETGLVADLEFSNVVNDPMENVHYIHLNFLASNVVGEPTLVEPEKCYEWKFFPFDSLPSNIFIGHAKIIPAFINKIIFVD
ncbi:MAG: NUDIX domain-containing protein [Candidatus Nomurabacteria bacterium]|nr:NUDIX domain-containing protein [Candidatus Nomurabacteria bacterium]